MRLDVASLRAEAEAHEKRLRGPLWSPGSREDPEDRDGGPDAPGSVPGPAERVPLGGTAPSAVLARLDALDAAVGALRSEVRAALRVGADPLAAVAAAAGDLRTYDAPDSRRAGVFVRVLPELRRAVDRVKERRGLRSDAGAWEYVVRLGIGAAATAGHLGIHSRPTMLDRGA